MVNKKIKPELAQQITLAGNRKVVILENFQSLSEKLSGKLITKGDVLKFRVNGGIVELIVVNHTPEPGVVKIDEEQAEKEDNKIRENHPVGYNLNENDRKEIINYITQLLGKDPIKNYKNIIFNDKFDSLRNISLDLNISRPTLIAHITSYLKKLYKTNEVEKIIQLFWPAKSAKQREKYEFFPSRNALLKNELKTLVSKNTFKIWVKNYLTQIKHHNIDKSEEIYNEIWGKQYAIKRKINFGDLKVFIHKRNGKIKTLEKEFNLLSEYPTDRYIKLECKKKHEFKIKVRKLIYDNRWCPICHENFCEKIMRNYMSQLFKKVFNSQVSLHQACGISKNTIIQ